ncbi:MAG: hypothetical protein LUE11_12625 [Clostridia bacterium]|nr:hypothetical protein [Clostridia bacterium]
MKEELIRIENGHFQYESREYQFDVSIAKGECIGIYVDEHLASGAAYRGIFSGSSAMKDGRAFACGNRVRISEMRRWIHQNCMIIDKHRFITKELTAWDYVVALGKKKKRNRVQWREADCRISSPESQSILKGMGIEFGWKDKLNQLSMLEYYKLAIYKAWFVKSKIVVLDRMTEILRRQDVEEFMDCVQQLLGQGIAVFVLDLDEEFMYMYANRIDVMKNRKICYRLYPEEYDERLYEILGWERRRGVSEREDVILKEKGHIVLHADDLKFESMPPLSFQIRSGEIVFLRDENYNTASQIRDCFLGEKGWESGSFCLGGKYYDRNALLKLVGKEIGIQIEIADRKGGVLFDNLTALDNLSSSLIPKAGMRIFRKSVLDNILNEASDWFERDELLRPISEWPLIQRLRLTYYKWYLMNPMLLICLFPFAGQESSHHEMIIQMLVTCAKRGMAIWIISSGIDAICEKTENNEFLERLRYLNE